tara:strand:- start:402 stop:788 length:387 start_codon:yes stop_codon:yes gene_type:complete
MPSKGLYPILPYVTVMELLQYSNDDDKTLALINKDMYDIIYERRKETTKTELVYLFEIFKHTISSEFLLIFMNYNIYSTVCELKQFLYDYLNEDEFIIQLRNENTILNNTIRVAQINWFEETVYIDYL